MSRCVPRLDRYWVFGFVSMLSWIGLPTPTFAQDISKDAKRFAQFTENIVRQTVQLGALGGYLIDKNDVEYATAVSLLRLAIVFNPSPVSQVDFALWKRGDDLNEAIQKANPKDLESRYLDAEILFYMHKMLSKSGGRPVPSVGVSDLYDLIKDAPNQPRYRELLAHWESFIATFHLDRDFEKSAEASRNAIKQWEYLIKNHGPKGRYLVGLAYDYTGLTSAMAFLGEKEGLEELDQKALEIRQKLVERYPQQAARYVDLGGSQCNLANHKFEIAHKHDQALEWYAKSIQSIERAVKLDPDALYAKDYLSNAHWGRMLVYLDLKKHADADAEWERSKKTITPAYLPERRLHRAKELAKAGRGLDAVREADELAKQAKRLPNQAILFALTYTHACDSFRDNPKTLERCQEQAVLWLGVLADDESGRNEVFLQHLKVAKDFELLRNRKDFQDLLKRVEKAIERNPMKTPPKIETPKK